MIRRISIDPLGEAAAQATHGDTHAVSEESRNARTAAVSVRGLTVSYGNRPVLRGVSFDVAGGQLVGVVGPNGAGKSTLLKALLGLIPSDGGSIRIRGRPVEACRAAMAYVPQTEAVDWDFPVTVEDVVLMGRYGRMGWFGRPGRADHRAALDALGLVGMTDFRRRHIRQLSGGQQQRVFLARALCQNAEILLLDEPFAGVDAATEQAIFDLIDELTGAGKTLVVVNHDLSVLDRFGSVLLLNQQVIAYGPTREVVNEQNLRRTYGGRLTLLDRADAALREHRGNV